MKPDNWRTDYDWTDPDDYPVQDDKIFDIQSEEELMLPHEIKAPPKGIESLREGRRFADVDPIEKKILELMARGLSRELAEVIVKSGMSEDSYEIMDKAEGGRIGFSSRGYTGEFSLQERLNARNPANENLAEHSQIGKLPWNITRRILELNRGGKSYEDIAQLTGVAIEDINQMLDLANNPDYIHPISDMKQMDPKGFNPDKYAVWDDINLEREQIRDRPEHLDYRMHGKKIRKAAGGRIGYAYGDDDPEIVEDDLTTLEFMQDQGVPYGEQASGIDKDVLIEKVVEEFIKRKGRKPRSIEEIKTFYMQEMAGGTGESPQRVAYNPGDYDPLIVEEYEKYKFGQEEQGAPVITIDEFMQMERTGAQAGGLPGILGF